MNLLNDVEFHQRLAWGVIFLSPIVAFILIVFQPSTYGKLHNSKHNWFGPKISAQWSWIIFESPNWLWVVYSLYNNTGIPPIPNIFLLGWFMIHYLYRSILYPLQMSTDSQFPIGIVAISLPYCIINGYLQSQGLCRFQSFPVDYMYSTQFLCGSIVTMIGFGIGVVSDRTLLRLRRTSSSYQIPHGGLLFHYVSCPHFLGEIVEWIGFCIACHGSLESISFVLWTMANLLPRALAQHAWYQSTFKDYPKNRTAIVPFLI